MAIASMNLAAQKKSTTDEAPCSETKDDNKTDSNNSDSLVHTNEDNSNDSDSDMELDKTANKLTSNELLASAFPYQKDLLYGSDHQKNHPFDQSNESIEFVCMSYIATASVSSWMTQS
jgi:hypothetical protein